MCDSDHPKGKICWRCGWQLIFYAFGRKGEHEWCCTCRKMYADEYKLFMSIQQPIPSLAWRIAMKNVCGHRTCDVCAKELPVDRFEEQRTVCKRCRGKAKNSKRKKLKIKGSCKKCGEPCSNFICKGCQRGRANARERELRKLKAQEKWGGPYVHPSLEGVPEGHKRCPGCQEVKPRTVEFFKNKSSRCRDCVREEKRSKNPPPIRRIDCDEWACNVCKTTLPNTLDFFSPRKCASGMTSTCRSCRSAAKDRTKHCTPPWLSVEDYERIFDIYAEARRLSVETGIPHEVDHILPIKGYHLSGLHVPWNLRILTKTENMKAWGHHLKEAKAMGITERIK